DRGSEFCGNPERHEYELYLAVEDIDHSRTKTKSPQTNGICERFHKTALNEFYRVAFRKKVYRSTDELQADLDAWIKEYNPQQCCPRHAGLPARCGSSLQRNDAGVWLCEYPGLSFQRSPVCACSLVSSLLLSGATMSQQSSLTQSAHSVRQVLTAYRVWERSLHGYLRNPCSTDDRDAVSSGNKC